MPRSIRHLAAARRDLIAIRRYIASNGADDAADALLRRIAQVLQRLALYPEIGVARPDLADGLRSLPVGRYVVFYDVTPDAIRLVRVLHAARDISPAYFLNTPDDPTSPP